MLSFYVLGPIKISYYGLTATLGVFTGLLLSLFLAKRFKINQEKIYNISFWLIVFGILGSRIYHILNDWSYYVQYPIAMFYIWHGGLAIHGGLLAGFLVLIFFTKKYKINFWRLTDIFLPAIVLGSAIGRWGNFFNQELFGKPINLPWKIFIDLVNRPVAYKNFSYFHPVFLYEFIWGMLIVLGLLIYLHWRISVNNRQLPQTGIITGVILIFWALGRFSVEFLRIDTVPIILDARLPQLVSGGLILIGVGIVLMRKVTKTRS